MSHQHHTDVVAALCAGLEKQLAEENAKIHLFATDVLSGRRDARDANAVATRATLPSRSKNDGSRQPLFKRLTWAGPQDTPQRSGLGARRAAFA